MSNKGKSKILWKILAAVSAVMIIGIIFLVYTAFCGNFITGMKYKVKVEDYISHTYPGKNYRVSNYRYDFVMEYYYFEITDPDSTDGSFRANYNSDGEITDTYADVMNLTNTLDRLDWEFSQEVNQVIEKHIDKKDKMIKGDFVPGEFGSGSCKVDDSFFDTESDYDYLKDKIYMDMPTDAKNMPLPTSVYVSMNTDRNESFRRIKEIATELKTLGYRIDYYEFSTNEETDWHELAYDMIPADKLFAAKSTEDLSEYIRRYYDSPELAPLTTRATTAANVTTAAPKK